MSEFDKILQAGYSLPCVCGHSMVEHEHWRAGDDCGACPCQHFQLDGPRVRHGKRRPREGAAGDRTAALVGVLIGIVAGFAILHALGLV